MAAATLGGGCTAAILEGPGAYARIAEEAARWLDAHGYASVEEVQGLFLRKFRDGQRVVTDFEEKPQLNETACIGCSRCEPVCCYGAISAPPDTPPVIREDLCFQCGLCVTVCPTEALFFRPRRGVTV